MRCTVYRILWHDAEGDNLSVAAYLTIRDATRTAQEVRACYQGCWPPGYDVVFAENGRIVPDWLRQGRTENVN